jgi:hypothetical protein
MGVLASPEAVSGCVGAGEGAAAEGAADGVTTAGDAEGAAMEVADGETLGAVAHAASREATRTAAAPYTPTTPYRTMNVASDFLKALTLL